MSEKKRGIRSATGRTFSRRDFLRVGGAGLAGATLLGGGTLASCGGGQQGDGPANVIFSFGPDDSGTLQELVDRFNREHEGEIRVEYRETSRITDEYFDELVSDFGAGATPPIDVIGGDVIWASEFADNGWIADITRRMYTDYSPRVPDAFLEAPITSCSFENKFWGVPWFTDTGLLYYRRDLLEDAGFSDPPATWDELKEMANRITQDANVQHGLVFQGADYEGGVANALEFIWNAGGNVLTGNITVNDPDKPFVVTPNIIEIDSDNSARGLQIARSMIEDGVSPEAVADFRENESLDAFNVRDAVFLRGWPYMYQIFDQEGQVDQDQVGIAQLPVAEEGMPSYSCLGGWNMYINSESPNVDAAWTFVKYATAPEQQKFRAREGAFLPTLRSLYGDEEVVDEVPVIARGREVIENNARSRPITPYYSDISARLARTFNASLRGELPPEEAVGNLQTELENIVESR
ncbi:ABC transporter substrate-binding protein [soil metagenome]